MQLDDILNPWIQQLETAAKPYFRFVDEVTDAISSLEIQVIEASQATPLNALENTQKIERELADQSLIRKSQQSKIDDLQAQIALLKATLIEAKNAAEVAQDLLTKQAAAFASANPISTDQVSSANFDSSPKRREPRAQTPKTPNFPERHVLLVDDAEINRVLMSHYFKGLPVKLEFAVSVNVALEKCKNRRFDLIVVDDELTDLENPILRNSSNQVVGLSNRAGDTSSPVHFTHVLSRGQAREAFIEQLKAYLWDAERIA
jgi:PleD family two-component response regulator